MLHGVKRMSCSFVLCLLLFSPLLFSGKYIYMCILTQTSVEYHSISPILLSISSVNLALLTKGLISRNPSRHGMGLNFSTRQTMLLVHVWTVTVHSNQLLRSVSLVVWSVYRMSSALLLFAFGTLWCLFSYFWCVLCVCVLIFNRRAVMPVSSQSRFVRLLAWYTPG